MPPPGWRKPEGADAVSTYGRRDGRPAAETTSDTGPATRRAVPAPVGARSLVAHLDPGLHVLAGPHGAGKTTFALHAAVEAALLGLRTRVLLPETPRREAALRVAAAMEGRRWPELEAADPSAAESALGRLAGAPLEVSALEDGPSADPWGQGSPELVVVDPARALEPLWPEVHGRHAVVLATLPSVGFGPEPELPPEWVQRADAVWWLTSSADGPTLRLLKNRRGEAGSRRLSFDGGRFVEAEISAG